MTVVTVPVVRGKDGKLYPSTPGRGHGRSVADNERTARVVHALRHRGLSFPQITARMGDYGLRVSYGSVYNLWKTTECDWCAQVPPEPPQPRQKARVVAWR